MFVLHQMFMETQQRLLKLLLTVSVERTVDKVMKAVCYNIDDISDNSPPNRPQYPENYGRTKEGYEGDQVTLTCSDDGALRGNIRVNFDCL